MAAEHPTTDNEQAQRDHSGHRRGGDTPESPAREDLERETAWRRGEARLRQRGAGSVPPRGGDATAMRRATGGPAFAALADGVRDYAIFLLDTNGIITYWGE